MRPFLCLLGRSWRVALTEENLSGNYHTRRCARCGKTERVWDGLADFARMNGA